MKRPHRHFFFVLTLFAQASHGCGPDQDRRFVFTTPREARIVAGSRDRAKAKKQVAKAEVPAATPNPASNGIDVPILQPD